MKTTWQDFLVSSLMISLLLGGSGFLLTSFVTPLTSAWMPNYHVLIDGLVFLACYGLLSALTLRLLLRVFPLRGGEFAMDEPAFAYWKLRNVLYRLGMGALKPLTNDFSRPLVQSLFGAKMGRNVAVGGTIDDPYMVTVEDGAVLGFGSMVSANVITSGKILLAPVHIGKNATIGAYAFVMAGARVGDGAVVMGGSMVGPGTVIAAGEIWRGNPARKWQAAVQRAPIGPSDSLKSNETMLVSGVALE